MKKKLFAFIVLVMITSLTKEVRIISQNIGFTRLPNSITSLQWEKRQYRADGFIRKGA